MNKSSEVEAFYKTWKWRRFRKIRIEMAGGVCEECRKRGVVSPAEEVHHIIELTAENVTDPVIALSVENTLALCADCHKKKRIKKRWRCDESGHVSLR